MVKIWAIIEDVGSEYVTEYPVVLSDNLESIEIYIKKNKIRDPRIVYKELEGIFKCGYDEGDNEDPDWSYWEGRKYSGYTWKNSKTGELDPCYEDREDIPDNELKDWKYGRTCEVYKEGKLIKKYFELAYE